MSESLLLATNQSKQLCSINHSVKYTHKKVFDLYKNNGSL